MIPDEGSAGHGADWWAAPQTGSESFALRANFEALLNEYEARSFHPTAKNFPKAIKHPLLDVAKSRTQATQVTQKMRATRR